MGIEEDWSQYYEATDMSAAVESWEEDRAKADRKLPLRPKDGEQIYRLLPKRKGAKHPHFYRVVYLHFIKPPNVDELMGVSMCPLKTEGFDGATCLICAGASKMRKTGANWQQLKDWGLLPSRHVYAGAVRLDNKGNAIDDEKDESAKPHIMNIPRDVESMLMPLLDTNSARFLGDIAHPMEGFNVIITRSGKGREGTEYSGMPLAKSTPLANLEWLKELPDLDHVEEVMGVPRVQELLGEHHPGSGYTPPKGLPAKGASAAVPEDEEDEYDLVDDPDNPGVQITIKDLRERQADPPIEG